MPGKHSDCCCCPNCTYRVELCCPCVCPAICVTFIPDDYADCDPESVELDWDNDINGYSGSLHGHDLYYFIERDPPAEGQERGPCKFKLRSDSLGYPEGYEYEWEIPCDPYEEIPCTTCLALETELSVPAEEYDECSGGTLSTECVEWVTPTNCDNCHCLCECLCAFVTKDGISYSGKLCWDEYEQNRWTGTLTGLDVYGAEVTLDMRVEVDRWGDVCDPETDYDCDPYDDSCAINAYIVADAGDIAGNWQKMLEPCELRAVTYSWNIERDPETEADDIEISVRCAICNEDCEPMADMPCCEEQWPRNLSMAILFSYELPWCDCTYPQTFPVTWTANNGWEGLGLWDCPTAYGFPEGDCQTHGLYVQLESASCDILFQYTSAIPSSNTTPEVTATWGTTPYSISVPFGNLVIVEDGQTIEEAITALQAAMEAADRKFEPFAALLCDPPMIWIRHRIVDTAEFEGVDVIISQ